MNPLSILIVEDNLELGRLFVEVLRTESTRVELIQDGQVALEYLNKTKPDIVVLDMQLPSLSGDQILTHIRADERLKDIRVVVVTANEMMASIVDNQADLVLLKPVSYTQLKTLISRLSAPSNR